MKREYKKPQISFETMKLNTAIATKCSYILLEDGTFTPWDNVGGEFFFVSEDFCSGGELSGFCYHNPDNKDVILFHDAS